MILFFLSTKNIVIWQSNDAEIIVALDSELLSVTNLFGEFQEMNSKESKRTQKEPREHSETQRHFQTIAVHS